MGIPVGMALDRPPPPPPEVAAQMGGPPGGAGQNPLLALITNALRSRMGGGGAPGQVPAPEAPAQGPAAMAEFTQADNSLRKIAEMHPEFGPFYERAKQILQAGLGAIASAPPEAMGPTPTTVTEPPMSARPPTGELRGYPS